MAYDPHLSLGARRLSTDRARRNPAIAARRRRASADGVDVGRGKRSRGRIEAFLARAESEAPSGTGP